MDKTLRPYQRTIVDSIKQDIESGVKESVVGACPSSGKTLIALFLLQEVKFKKALIVPHGTNVIKKLWTDEIEKHSKFNQIDVKLHQSFHHNPDVINDYDIVIIDESHEFTFGKVTSKTFEKYTGQHIVHLTGTPSKFIDKGYKPYIVSALELIEKNYIADLSYRLFSTTVDLKAKDFNDSDGVKEGSAHKLIDSCEEDLKSLMKCMCEQLKSTLTNRHPNITNFIKNFPSLGDMGKTLIACHSIAQADKVGEFFKNKGVKCLISHSKNDRLSENVDRFSDSNSDAEVLVVVDRCVLGYNLEKLVNVVDMTGSHNIDIIYQLYARVMRKLGNTRKYFYKLCPDKDSDYHKFFSTAALCLMDRDFISNYNGKNLNNMEIPVRVIPTTKRSSKKEEAKAKVLDDIKASEKAVEDLAERKSKEDSVEVKQEIEQEIEEKQRNIDVLKEKYKEICKKKSRKNAKAKVLNVDALFYNTVVTSDMLTDIFHKKGDVLSEIAFRRIADIKKSQGIKVVDVENNKKQILEWIKKHKKKPSRTSKDQEERCLSMSMYSYMQPSHDCYDENFKEGVGKLLILVGWESRNNSKENKKLILSFIKTNKTKPSQDSKNKEEKRLGQLLSRYIGPKGGCYDENFKKEVKELAYSVGLYKIFGWTLEACIEDARQHGSKKDWKSANGSSHSTAYNNGWVDECCRHMPKKTNTRSVVDTKTDSIYKSITEAAKATNISKSTLGRKLKGKIKNNTGLKFLDEYNKEKEKK